MSGELEELATRAAKATGPDKLAAADALRFAVRNRSPEWVMAQIKMIGSEPAIRQVMGVGLTEDQMRAVTEAWARIKK